MLLVLGTICSKYGLSRVDLNHIYFLLLLPLAIASCGDDKEEPQTNTTKDPDGTVIVNINQGGRAQTDGVEIRLNDSYNLSGYSWGDSTYISIVGPVKSIASINATKTSVRNLTWTHEAAAQVGYGYIFRAFWGWNGSDDILYSYYAVYVDSEIVSASGSVLGYKLKVRKLLEGVVWTN